MMMIHSRDHHKVAKGLALVVVVVVTTNPRLVHQRQQI
jgi:hypothetical protein